MNIVWPFSTARPQSTSFGSFESRAPSWLPPSTFRRLMWALSCTITHCPLTVLSCLWRFWVATTPTPPCTTILGGAKAASISIICRIQVGGRCWTFLLQTWTLNQSGPFLCSPVSPFGLHFGSKKDWIVKLYFSLALYHLIVSSIIAILVLFPFVLVISLL